MSYEDCYSDNCGHTREDTDSSNPLETSFNFTIPSAKDAYKLAHDSSNPPYYKFDNGSIKFELIDILEALFPDEPLLWQVQKYIARWKHKDTPLKNLKKAAWYLNRKIHQLEKKEQHNVQNQPIFP